MHKDRHIRIRAERRTEPDVRKLSKALIALAMAQAKAEKDAETQDNPPTDEGGPAPKSSPRRPA